MRPFSSWALGIKGMDPGAHLPGMDVANARLYGHSYVHLTEALLDELDQFAVAVGCVAWSPFKAGCLAAPAADATSESLSEESKMRGRL